MRKKPLELSLYVAGAGAFGVFLRWLENQLAFDEKGLADPSAFHVIVPLFLITCLVVFWRFLEKIEAKRYYIPEDFSKALTSEHKLHTILSYAVGAVMALGALLLFSKSETDTFVVMVRLVSGLALLSGIAFPLVLWEAKREKPRHLLLCPMMLLPMLLYAVWLVLSYRRNAINSAPRALGLYMRVALAAMAANFRMAGFAFGGAKPKRALLGVMFSGSLCIMSLADSRYLGMQMILLATAGEMLLYTWILLQNLKKKERRVVVKKDDGFEHL